MNLNRGYPNYVTISCCFGMFENSVKIIESGNLPIKNVIQFNFFSCNQLFELPRFLVVFECLIIQFRWLKTSNSWNLPNENVIQLKPFFLAINYKFVITLNFSKWIGPFSKTYLLSNHQIAELEFLNITNWFYLLG